MAETGCDEQRDDRAICRMTCGTSPNVRRCQHRSGFSIIRAVALVWNEFRTVRTSLRERGTNVNWQDRITVDPNVLVGKPIIRGTRISVEFVVDLLGRGWTTEQILREYDHLTAADVQACLAYASDVLKSERVYLLPTV